jgi:SAM-dependent methyltransferase
MSQAESYLRRFKRYGVNPRTLKWQSARAAEQRYQEIVSLADFEGKSVLDVGCGFGGIIPFITKVAKQFAYTGIDRVGEFVEAAKKLYPRHRFIVGDYFARPLTEKFDIVIANGSLNANVPNNQTYREKAIRVMSDHAREAVIFNLAATYTGARTARGSNVWFAEPVKMKKFCTEIANRAIFIDHPKRRELTALLVV